MRVRCGHHGCVLGDGGDTYGCDCHSAHGPHARAGGTGGQTTSRQLPQGKYY